MALPTLRATFCRPLKLLVTLTTLGPLAASAGERSAPVIDWNLRQMPETLSSDPPGLPPELLLTRSDEPLFDKQRPHALRFTSDQERLRVTPTAEQSVTLPRAALTLEVWVRPKQDQKHFGLVCCKKNRQMAWLLGGDQDHFFFTLASESKKKSTRLTARPFYQTAQWYQLVATYDGQQQRIYVDGKLAGEAFEQRGNLLPLQSPEIQIGVLPPRSSGQTNPTFFSGQMAMVRIWDRALSVGEIKKRFDAKQALFPGALAVYDSSRDWPTFGHDNHRSGRADAEPALPLHLAWYRQIRPGPRPAWPPPAQQDFWHNKQNLQPRVSFDRCFEPVVAQGKVYLGSSSNDQLYCLDLATGKELWRFFADAPIRLAPTVTEKRVLFGSDDGGVYCLDAQTGDEIWRYQPAGKYFPGNGRLVHPQLVRSGIFVEQGKVWFTTGLFPQQGVHLVTLDLRDGKLVKKSPLQRSPQGYLSRRGGRLFATTGRNLQGALLESLESNKKDPVIERPSLLAPFDRTAIEAGNLIFAGGPGKVAAFSREEHQLLWQTEIEGTCGSLVLAGNHLLASTAEGDLYCFTPQKQKAEGDRAFIKTSRRMKVSDDQTVETILATTGLRQGYCLLLGDDLGEFAIQIALLSEMQVIVGMQDAAKIESLRKRLQAMNLYGQVTVHDLDHQEQLPYGSWLFNLVLVTDSKDNDLPFSPEELWRVVRPAGGCLWNVKTMQPTYRRPLAGAGEWTHLYGNASNTACSGDALVRGTFTPQWFGLPGPQGMIDRHHRTASPLCKSGMLYVPGNEKMYGVDAYNGTVRWETAVPGSRRIGVLRDCGPMCAVDEGIFIAAGKTCSLFSAANGQPIRQFKVPASKEKAVYEWGFVAAEDGLLFGSRVPEGGIRREHSRQAIIEGTYWDFRPLVASASIFAFAQNMPNLKWHYVPADRVILNPTITLGGGRIYFVELKKPETQKTSGRVRIDRALDEETFVVALDQQTGEILWKKKMDYASIEHHLYGLYQNEIYFTIGSRNQASTQGPETVWYDIHAIYAATGSLLWQASQNNKMEADGDHGEQDHHPVIVEDRLYVEPFAYDLNTGKRQYDWGWQRGHRGGCGTIAASNTAFFFRDRHAAMFDLKSKQHSKVTQISRPGCWINMLPAGGLLLIPEASSGCTCHFAVQASMAFRPTKRKGETLGKPAAAPIR